MAHTRCPQCGALLPPGSLLGGTCPACLLKLALDAGSVSNAAPDSGDGVTGLRPEATAVAVPDRIGPYHIVRVLGQGGMGVVYLAEQREPIHRRVALKLIKPGAHSGDVLKRFEAERQALALMDHPNIARVLDAGAGPDGLPYFVMEYVPGIPITDYCDRNRLSTAERLELFLPVCAAIQHAHQKGVVHRDLKPSNILVTLQDGHPTPKIIDFGVAKAIYRSLGEQAFSTQIGTLIGTPEYMSPEQADSTALDVDTTTDIYSLGVVLYELLTSSLPFDATTLQRAGYAEIRRIICEVEPPRPSVRLSTSAAAAGDVAHRHRTSVVALEREMRGDLDCITMKAIEKDRSRRYASASELAADITRYLKGDVIAARPPSLTYRTRKFLRRHKVGVAASGLIFAALIAGLITSTVFYIGAERARNTADEQAYAASIGAAAALLAADQPNEARSRLLQVPRRGWEWWHLFLATDTSIATLYPRGDFLHTPARSTSFVFAADGSRFFWNTDTAVQAWDIRTQQLLVSYGKLGRILAMGPQASSVVVRAYNDDSKDYTLRVLETSSGRVLTTFAGHASGVECAAFSSDGMRIVSGSRDGAFVAWDARSGKLVSRVKGTGGGWCVVAFSPDGERIASGTWGAERQPQTNEILLWETESAKPALALRGHEQGITALAFSQDGAWLASGSADGTIRTWSLPSGAPTATLRGHENQVLSLAFCADGRRLASGADDSTVRVWDLASRREIMRDAGFFQAAISVAFSPDGSRLLAAGSEHFRGAEIRIWDTEALGPWRVLAHDSDVNATAFSADGTTVAGGTEDGKVVLWDVTSRERLRVLSGHAGSVTAVAFHPFQPRIASGSADNTVRLWDARSGRLLMKFDGHRKPITAVAFSPAGTEIAAAGEDGLVRVWDATSGASLARWQGSQPVWALVFGRSGDRLLFGSGDPTQWPSPDGRIRVWDWRSGEILLAKEMPDRGAIVALAVGPADGRIAVGVSSGQPSVWDATLTKRIGMLGLAEPAPTRSLAFSPDGARILSLSMRGVATAWDASTLKPLLTLNAPDRFLWEVSFAGDGRRIAFASRKGLRICDSVSVYHPDAPKLVDRLSEELVLADAVSTRLRSDRTLEPALRQAALRLVQARGDDPDGLNRLAWQIVGRADAGADAYRLAQRRAQAAVHLAPDRASYWNTLGVAQYRTGSYREAIATLERGIALRHRTVPEDLAFLAMAHQRMGDARAAHESLDRLRTAMKDPANATSRELQGFLAEVEAIVRH